jgi:chromosome segregation ATPase
VARVQNIEKILDLVEELFDELENTDVQDLFESLPDMEQDEVVELRSSIEDWVDGLDEVISRLPELQSSIVELKADLERLNDSVVELEEDFDEE